MKLVHGKLEVEQLFEMIEEQWGTKDTSGCHDAIGY